MLQYCRWFVGANINSVSLHITFFCLSTKTEIENCSFILTQSDTNITVSLGKQGTLQTVFLNSNWFGFPSDFVNKFPISDMYGKFCFQTLACWCIYKMLYVQSAESTLSHKMLKKYNLYLPLQFRPQFQKTVKPLGKFIEKNSKAAQIMTNQLAHQYELWFTAW